MDKKNIITAILLIIILVLITVGFVYFNTNTGKAFTTIKKGVYQDNVDKTFLTNSVMLWKPNQQGVLNGLAITGKVSGKGQVRSYLVDEKDMYLIMELNLENETISFANLCNETCKLNNFVEEKYLIRFELTEDIKLNVDTITYGLGERLNQTQ